MTFTSSSSNSLKNADFLVKSSFGISVIALIIVAPFAVNSFVQGRFMSGVILCLVSALCIFSIYHCYRGRYLLWLNLFAIVPSISVANLYAFHQLGVGGAFWAYMVVFTMYFVLPPKYAKVCNAIFLMAAIYIAYSVLEPSVYLRFSAALVGSSFFILVAVREIFRQQDQLKEQSVTDPLTGLFNRASLQECTDRSLANYRKQQTPCSIAILDIDHFKKINDTFGHDVGDTVIIKLADCIKQAMSGKDIVFRIGGEEFLLLLNDTPAQEAFLTMEALRAVVEDLDFIEDYKVTISIGLASASSISTSKEWTKLADEHLYQAKESGRNQVVQ